ncbi:MAG: biotin transporter BioY [Cyanophyceae cyanobacterium]
MSAPNQLLWAIAGLLLTIAGTFIEAFIASPPWQWSQGIHVQPLGITYQIAAVLLTGCLGGQNAGAISQVAYVVLGLFWLPVFAYGGGIEYVKEPSFGYILGFIPGAWLCGWLAFRTKAKPETLALSAIGGLAMIHGFGILYLVGLATLAPGSAIAQDLQQAIATYSLAPLPGQLVAVCGVAVVGYVFRKILLY